MDDIFYFVGTTYFLVKLVKMAIGNPISETKASTTSNNILDIPAILFSFINQLEPNLNIRKT